MKGLQALLKGWVHACCLRAGNLKERYSQYSITYRDVLSAALYPKVFDEFKCARARCSCLPRLTCFRMPSSTATATDCGQRRAAAQVAHLQLPLAWKCACLSRCMQK